MTLADSLSFVNEGNYKLLSFVIGFIIGLIPGLWVLGVMAGGSSTLTSPGATE